MGDLGGVFPEINNEEKMLGQLKWPVKISGNYGDNYLISDIDLMLYN